jgi:hypothetical protein
MLSNRKALITLCFSLFWVFCETSQAADSAWSQREAEEKVGARVQCICNPNQGLLQWGPNLEGWERSKQPKALGRTVKVGAKGTVKEILRVSKGKYHVVVHWDQENAGGPFWTTVMGPDEYNRTIASIPKSEIVGKWREIGKRASLEISVDGTFKAIDNEGMAVAGKYTLVEHGRIKFAIQNEKTPEEIVNLGFSINGDELTLTPSDGGQVERYRKVE